MEFKAFINKINFIESKLNLNKLEYKDFNYWPVARITLRNKYYSKKKINVLKKYDSLATKLLRVFKSTLNYLNNKKLQQSDVVFFTRSSEVNDIVDDKYFNRYSDSFSEIISNNIQVIETGFINRNRKYYYRSHVFNTDLISIILLLKSRLFKSNVDISEINKLFYEEFNLTIDLSGKLEYIYLLSKYYKKLLKKVDPKYVFLACFYREEAFAMSIACHDMQIKSIEYQHGAQNKYHWMYTHWSNPPKDGFKVIPEVFWMWGNQSKERIDKWAENTSKHSSIVGGNLWLLFKKNYQKKQLDLFTNKPNILVSLQGDSRLPDYVLDHFLNNNVNWIFRDHPRAKITLDLKNKLQAISPYDIDEYSEIDLYSLLNNIDLHLTGYSTVAFEAQCFDKPTIFYHPDAKDGHGEYLGRNGLYYADNKKELELLITELLNNKPQIDPEYIIADKLIAENALASIIKK